MGDLVTMTRPVTARRGPSKNGGADILFFTGVRYVRITEGAEPAAVLRQRETTDKTSEALRPDHQV